MTVIIACVSDLHAGSTVALCPPRITLDDGGDYSASKPQLWLWQSWLDIWARVERLRNKEKAKLICVFNGDMTEGAHHGTTQILSGNASAQAAVVDAVLKIPLSLKPDGLALVRGTETHVGPSASNEERIARGLSKDGWKVQRDPETGSFSRWHMRMDVQGVRFDFAHHGRVGSRPWTRPNVTANLAAEIFYDHCKEGRPYPHIAIRSHMHQLVDTHDQHPVRVIQTPAWQLATAFIHRIAPGKLADIGGLIILVRDGVATVDKVMYRPQAAPAWKVA